MLTHGSEAGHTCLGLGHALVLKKLFSCKCVLRKREERLRLNVTDEKATKGKKLVPQDKNVNGVCKSLWFYCTIFVWTWSWK